MRFLADQDVYQTTIEFLRNLGHDVLRAKEAGLHSAPDIAVLEYARREDRVLLTRDKGYGALAFLDWRDNRGILLLRIDLATTQAVHNELRRFFGEHPAIVMESCFVVIEPGRHRIRATKG